jgi:membrane-bound lytic murein transglycosylase
MVADDESQRAERRLCELGVPNRLYTEVSADVLKGYQDEHGHESKELQPLDRGYVFFRPANSSRELA